MDDKHDVVDLVTLGEVPVTAADQPSTTRIDANSPASFLAAATALAAMDDALRDAQRETPTPLVPAPSRCWPP